MLAKAVVLIIFAVSAPGENPTVRQAGVFASPEECVRAGQAIMAAAAAAQQPASALCFQTVWPYQDKGV